MRSRTALRSSHGVSFYSYPKQSWTRFITAENRTNVSHDALDLLDKLLRYDHHERLTAAEALSHTYFSQFTALHTALSILTFFFLCRCGSTTNTV